MEQQRLTGTLPNQAVQSDDHLARFAPSAGRR
jgi:hypothetical protein